MSYVLGASALETRRLDMQSEIFERETRRTLELSGLKRGMKCLDLGCGTGTSTFLIADIVGKDGSIVGLDISEDRIRLCKRRAKEKHVANVRFVAGNVYNPELEHNYPPFDFVFSRFLFQHLTHPEEALIQILKLIHADAIIAIEEFSHGSWLSYPYDANVEKLRRSYVKLARLAGSDPYVARNLYTYFQNVGLRPISEVYSVSIRRDNEPYNNISPLLADVLEKQFLKNRIMSRMQFKEMRNGLQHFSANKHAAFLYTLVLRLWSRR